MARCSCTGRRTSLLYTGKKGKSTLKSSAYSSRKTLLQSGPTKIKMHIKRILGNNQIYNIMHKSYYTLCIFHGPKKLSTCYSEQTQLQRLSPYSVARVILIIFNNHKWIWCNQNISMSIQTHALRHEPGRNNQITYPMTLQIFKGKVFQTQFVFQSSVAICMVYYKRLSHHIDAVHVLTLWLGDIYVSQSRRLVA